MSYLPPKRLRAGSKVAIVAPASPFKTDELIAGLDIIREVGLQPVLGPSVRNFRVTMDHAGPAAHRVDELMWAFTEPGIDAVITVCGGIGSGEVLPHLNYEAIRRSRRMLVGLSDITALNNGILAQAGLISVNGQYPTIRIDKGRMIREADSESMLFTLQLMMDAMEWGERPFELNRLMPRTVSPGKAVGHVIGGNLDTFCTLLGTPYAPELDGAIFFIEDVHKNGQEIQRLLIHCKLAGVFEKVGGIVVGEFIDVPKMTEENVPSVETIIEEYLSDGPPCVYGYSFSHGAYTIPIPIGARCEMDADTGRVAFRFAMAP